MKNEKKQSQKNDQPQYLEWNDMQKEIERQIHKSWAFSKDTKRNGANSSSFVFLVMQIQTYSNITRENTNTI